MKAINSCGVGGAGYRLTAAGTGGLACWDTKGYDGLNVFILGYNASAASSGCVSAVELSESDTLTSPTSQTAILDFTGGTATSTAVGFVIGGDTANTGQTGIIELAVDLKGRKRYVGLQVTVDQGATNFLGILALGSRAEASKDTRANKLMPNLCNTMASLVTLVNDNTHETTGLA